MFANYNSMTHKVTVRYDAITNCRVSVPASGFVTVTFKVVGEDGAPIRNAYVSIDGQDDYLRTDSDGHASVAGQYLPEDEIVANVSAKGFRPQYFVSATVLDVEEAEEEQIVKVGLSVRDLKEYSQLVFLVENGLVVLLSPT